MFGNYRISQGVYKFSLQEVIRKDFVIKDGSTINFNGALLDANMDIQASYTVNSASLNDLIPDASTVIQQPNVRVNCIMNLSGVLLQPTIKLGIELPNERDEIQSLVRNYISTEEQMNMQILYLLGVGKFYTEDIRAGKSKRLRDDFRSFLYSLRATEQCSFANFRNQQLEYRNQLEYRRQRLDRCGIRRHLVGAVIKQPAAD